MNLAKDLTKFLDVGLLLIAAATVTLGFGIAHWNGLRLAADTTGGPSFASAYYELGFSQGAWSVQILVIAAGLIAGVATILKIGDFTRLAIQLAATSAIYAAFLFAALMIWL